MRDPVQQTLINVCGLDYILNNKSIDWSDFNANDWNTLRCVVEDQVGFITTNDVLKIIWASWSDIRKEWLGDE